MIVEKLERRDSNVANEIFLTQTREYKRVLHVCLSCLCLVCGVCKMGSVMHQLQERLVHSSAFHATCASCLNIQIFYKYRQVQKTLDMYKYQSALENSKNRAKLAHLGSNLGSLTWRLGQVVGQCTLASFLPHLGLPI